MKEVCLALLPVFVREKLREYRTRQNVPNALGREFTLQEKSLEEIFGMPIPSCIQMDGAYIRKKQDIVSPLYELFNIAAISAILQPQRVFEIGTHLGASALMIGKNVPASTEIFTLDLPQKDLSKNNVMNPTESDNPYEVGELFKNGDEAKRIQQLYGDSTQFDYSPYFNNIDLIFIDGNHEYDFVKSDSINAFKMLRPGGCIIWDDYHWDYDLFWCAGVTQYLNEIAEEHNVYRIAGTRLGIYRKI